MKPSYVCSLGLLLISTVVLAEPLLPELQVASDQVRSKEYQQAIDKVRPLLDGLTLNTVDHIILAHRLLGVSYCEIGNQDKGIEHFRSLLLYAPQATITDLNASKKCELLLGGLKGTDPATPAPSPTSTATSVKDDAAWKRWVPFGYGQFANGEKAKGWAFAIGESATSAAAIATAYLFTQEKNPNGTFKNAGLASVYRSAFWGSVGATAGLAIWGVFDATQVYDKQQKKVSLQVSPFGAEFAFKF